MQNNDYARHKKNNMNKSKKNSECGKKGKKYIKDTTDKYKYNFQHKAKNQ